MPRELKEASYGLGATKLQTILKVALPYAATGILTGILLSIARVAGETAPLLFTSFNNNYFSLDMGHPMSSLTATIFQYAMGPYAVWHEQAWAASLIITVFILALTILGRLIIKWRYK